MRREATFEDAFLQAQSCDLLQCVRGGCLLSVGFVDAVGPSLSSLEAGSPGYGPRKEFFLLAGQAIVHQSSGAAFSQPKPFGKIKACRSTYAIWLKNSILLIKQGKVARLLKLLKKQHPSFFNGIIEQRRPRSMVPYFGLLLGY